VSTLVSPAAAIFAPGTEWSITTYGFSLTTLRLLSTEAGACAKDALTLGVPGPVISRLLSWMGLSSRRPAQHV
jgi:hypothetical protein